MFEHKANVNTISLDVVLLATNVVAGVEKCGGVGVRSGAAGVVGEVRLDSDAECARSLRQLMLGFRLSNSLEEIPQDRLSSLVVVEEVVGVVLEECLLEVWCSVEEVERGAQEDWRLNDNIGWHVTCESRNGPYSSF